MSTNSRRPMAALLFSSVLALVSMLATAPSAAAQVRGDVVINGGPVRGRIAVGEPVFIPRPIIIYQPVRGRRLEVARYAPRVVVVERGHGRYGKSAKWYQRHGYRPVTLFYSQGRYYTQVFAARGYRWGPQFIAVTAWERSGRIYLASGGSPERYGYTSRYDPHSSHGYLYEDEYPNGDGRDWDD